MKYFLIVAVAALALSACEEKEHTIKANEGATTNATETKVQGDPNSMNIDPTEPDDLRNQDAGE